MWERFLDLFTYKAMDLNCPKIRAWQAENKRLAGEGYTLIYDGQEWMEKDGIRIPREPAPLKRYWRWDK